MSNSRRAGTYVDLTVFPPNETQVDSYIYLIYICCGDIHIYISGGGAYYRPVGPAAVTPGSDNRRFLNVGLSSNQPSFMSHESSPMQKHLEHPLTKTGPLSLAQGGFKHLEGRGNRFFVFGPWLFHA